MFRPVFPNGSKWDFISLEEEFIVFSQIKSILGKVSLIKQIAVGLVIGICIAVFFRRPFRWSRFSVTFLLKP